MKKWMVRLLLGLGAMFNIANGAEQVFLMDHQENFRSNGWVITENVWYGHFSDSDEIMWDNRSENSATYTFESTPDKELTFSYRVQTAMAWVELYVNDVLVNGRINANQPWQTYSALIQGGDSVKLQFKSNCIGASGVYAYLDDFKLSYYDDAQPTYELVVSSGTGDNTYTNGATVSISADTPSSGYDFSHWTSDPAQYTNNLADAFAASTTFTMPTKNVTLTANFVEIDSDGDGMDDAWEMQYFQTLEKTADDDFDADGRTNGEEFEDGTDPTDPGSTLGLVAYYPFDGNADDASGNGHHGTENGGVVYGIDRQGSVTSCLTLNGTDAWVGAPATTSIVGDNPEAWSYTVWFKADDWSSSPVLLSDYDSSNYDNNYAFLACTDDGGVSLSVSLRTAGTTYSMSGPGVSEDGWHCMAVSVSKTDSEMRLYIDGEFSGSVSINPSADYFDGSPLYLGTQRFQGSRSRFFDGSLDDVRIYDRALSSNEVVRIYTETMPDSDSDGMNDEWETTHFGDLTQTASGDYDADGRTNGEEEVDGTDPTDPGSTLGLVAYYPLDGDANDASGNNLGGNSSGCSAAADRYGEANRAFYFDGVDDFIDLPDLPDVTTQLTVTCWANLQTVNDGYNKFYYYFNTRDWTENGRCYAGWQHDDGMFIDVYGGTPLLYESLIEDYYDRWELYAFTVDCRSKEIRQYLGGRMVDSVSSASFVESLDLTPTIGGHFNYAGVGVTGRSWKGLIDDVRIYARALSSNEMARLYTETVPTNVPPPMYTLSVENGSGDNSYTNGAVVAIAADAPASGYTFSHWTSDPAQYTNNLADANAASTTFTMPATNVTLTANYVLIPEGDYDGDGRTNAEELSDGTDPMDPGSTLGLFAYYPFDGNANDESGNGLDAPILEGDPSFSAGRIGGAIDLDGTGDYVKLPKSTVFDINSDQKKSISLWFKARSFGGTFVTRWKETGGWDARWVTYYDGEDGEIRGEIQDGSYGTEYWGSGDIAETNEWHHIAYIYNRPAKQMLVYLDGQEIYDYVIGKTGNMANGNYPTIGGKTDEVSFGGRGEFNGLIDSVRYYDRLLSPEEVARLYGAEAPTNSVPIKYALNVEYGSGDNSYTNGATVSISADTPAVGYEFSHWTAEPMEYTNNLVDVYAAPTTFTMPATNVTLTANYALFPSGDYDGDGRTNAEELTDGTDPMDAGSTLGLIAYYPLDGDASDASGNGHDGTVLGGLSFASGVSGLSADFVGNYQKYVRIPHHADLNFTTSFSIGVWVKADALSEQTFFISKGRDIYSSYAFRQDDHIFFHLNYTGSYGDSSGLWYPNSHYSQGEWVFVVCTIDKSTKTVKGYVNGNLIRSGTLAKDYVFSTTHDLVLGRHDTDNNGSSSYAYPFRGDIDDLRIYNRVISPSEVERLYQSIISPPTQYTLTVELGSGDNFYTNGATVSIAADAPASGYEFSHWTADPAQYTNNLADAFAASTTFTMPATNVTLTANYVLLPTYVITTTAGANGSISPVNPSVVQGDDQAFTISPNVGYHIASVDVDGQSMGVVSSYTFTDVQSAHTIAATFAINTYRVEFDLNGGSRSGGGEMIQYVEHGGYAVEPIVTPPAGYGNLTWSSALGPITSPRTITAQYEQTGSSWHTVTFSEGAHGHRTGGGELSQQVLHAHAATAPTIQADTGWEFAGWTAPFDAVLANLQIEAVYIRDPAYKQLSVSSAYGSPSVSGSVMYTNGSAVDCTMASMVISNAAAIHTCTGWSASDGSSGSGSTASLTMDEDITLSWNWESQYYLSISTSGPGSVDVTSGYQPAGSTVELTAVPDSGNEFQGWSGAASGMNPTSNITMTGAKNVTATFGAHLVSASIDTLSPARTTLDTPVSFSGSAAASGGASITQVRWRMIELVDNVETGDFMDLSDQLSFIKTDLPDGHWRVYFDAQDSTGAWSDAATRELRIENPAFLTDLAVTRTDLRFLAADGSELDPMMANQVRLGDEVTVEVTVRNLGGLAVTNPVTVSLCDGSGPSDLTAYSSVPNLLGSNTVASIAAGGSATTVIDWQVGSDINGNAIANYDGTFRLLSAWAEHAANHAEAVDGDSEELPVYEANPDNNKGQATILIGEVPLEDYEMVMTLNDTTVNEDRQVVISGQARYEWLDHDSAVVGAMVTVQIDGQTLSGTTDANGRFSVNAGYLPVGSYPVSAEVNDGTLTASDTATATVNALAVPPPPKADLRVTAVQVAGPGMYETESTMPHTLLGSNVTVSATIYNGGNLTAGQPFAVRFSVDGSGEVIGTATVTNSLAPGVSRAVTCPAVWSTNVVGTYSIRATVDADAQVDEKDENNNARTLAVAVHEGRPDLRPYYISGQTVQTLSVSPAEPVQGELLTLGVEVFNAGPVAMTQQTFAVQFAINGTPVGTTNVTAALASQGSIRVEVPWDTASVQPGHQMLTASVDFNDDVLEDFENNNVAQTTFDLAPAVPSLVLVQTDYETYLFGRTANVQIGHSLNLDMHVKNVGGADYESGSFLRLSENTLGNIVDADPVPGMGVDRIRDMRMTWTAPGTPTNLLLLVHVDGSVVSRQVHVYEPSNPPPPPPPVADPSIVPADISIPGEWTRGSLVQAAATVRNAGTLAASNLLVQFYYSVDSVGYTPLGTSQLIEELPVGGATNLLSNASLEAVEPYYTIKVRLTPSGGNDRSYNDVATRAFAIEAPWADAGDNDVTVVGRTVTLDGTASQYHTAYDWTFSSLPAGSAAVLSGADTAHPTFVPDVPGSYEVQLQVTDGELYSPYSWVTILANAQVGTELTVSSAYGSPNPAVGTHTVLIGSTNTVSVAHVTVGGTNWHCTGWTGTGILPNIGNTNAADLVVVDELPTLTWLWETNVWLEATVASGEGLVAGGNQWLAAGTNVTLTASPSNGYVFAEWTGDLEGCTVNGASVEVPMGRARSLTAQFLPLPVSGLNAQVTSLNSVELSWSYSGLSNALFRIEKLPGGESSWQTLATQSARTFVDDTVAEGDSMFYRVLAVVGVEESAPQQVQVEVPYLPAVPGGFGAEALSFNEVSLFWQPAARASGYAVQRRSLPLGDWAPFATTTSTGSSDSSVDEGKRYAYRVRSFNSAGNSAFTDAVAVTVPMSSTNWTFGMQVTNAVVSSNALCGAEISASFDVLLSNPIDERAQHRVAAGLRDTNGVVVGSVVEIAEAAGIPAHPPEWMTGMVLPEGLRLPAEPGVYALWIEDFLVDGDPREAFAARTHTNETQMARLLQVFDARLPEEGDAFVALSSASGAAGEVVEVPVHVGAIGGENAFSFSLIYDDSKLEFIGLEPVDAMQGCYLEVNDESAGSVGALMLLPLGIGLDAGVQNIALARFRLSEVLGGGTVVNIAFGDDPSFRMVTDPYANLLPHVWYDGDVQVVSIGYEADVSPRGQPDNLLTAQDRMQIMRFAVGLDEAREGTEFQRADCAPIASLGDGQIDIRDAVIATRYVGGAEPLKDAGGPSGPVVQPVAMRAMAFGDPVAMATSGAAGLIELDASFGVRGDLLQVPVLLLSGGNVEAVSFSVSFDPDELAFLHAEPAAVCSNAVSIFNSEQSGSGLVSYAVRMPSGMPLPSGSEAFVTLHFRIADAAEDAVTSMQVVSSPTPVMLATGDGSRLSASAQGTSVYLMQITQDGAPSAVTNLAATTNGTRVLLSWDDVEEENAYAVYRRSEALNWSLLAELSENTVRYVDNGLQAGASYAYRIVATNGAGESSSDPVSVEIPSVYRQWASEAIASAEKNPDEDADGDGLANRLEFLMGRNPSIRDANALRTGREDLYGVGSDYFTLTFEVEGTEATDSIRVQTTDSLTGAQWETAPQVENIQSNGMNRLKFRSRYPMNQSGSQFIRLQTLE